MLLSYAGHNGALGWPETGRNSSELKEFVNKLPPALESRQGASAENPDYPYFLPNILWLSAQHRSVMAELESACVDTATNEEMLRTQLHSCFLQWISL